MVGNRHRAVSMAFNSNLSQAEKAKSQESISQLKSIYKDIRYDWPQLAQGEAVPLELAIAFLDDTSVGLAHRKEEFDSLCNTTGQALQSAVVENHEMFTNSIGLYHQLLGMIKASREDSAGIKAIIEGSTRDIKDRGSYLKEYDQSSAKYQEMLDVLDAMEYMRDLPSHVDKLVAEKKIHEIYDLIAEAYKTASTYNLWSLSSMSATKAYLELQSNNLYDVIVDELLSEIYLKQPQASEEFWDALILSSSPQLNSFKTLITRLTTLETFIYNSANLDIFEFAQTLTTSAQTFILDQLPQLHQQHSSNNGSRMDYSLLLDSTKSSSTRTYFYIYMLLATAYKLNKLPAVIEILQTSLQLELQMITALATEQTKTGHQGSLARIAKTQSLESHTHQDIVSGQSFSDAAVPVLQEFFGKVFLRYLAILMRHKVTHDVIKLLQKSYNGVSTKRELSAGDTSSQYDIQTVWAVMKKEISTLVLAYISDDSQSTHIANADLGTRSLQSVLVEKKIFILDEPTKNSDLPTSLRLVLDEIFPKVQAGGLEASLKKDVMPSIYITNEHSNSMVEVLTPKHVYNMRVIVEFFLLFMSGSYNLRIGLQDVDTENEGAFVKQIRQMFVTQLRQKVNTAFDDAMANKNVTESGQAPLKHSGYFNKAVIDISDLSMSQTVPSSLKLANQKQVYANAVNFRHLFGNLCHTMSTSYTYRPDTTNLALQLLDRFLMSYHNYFLELLSTGGNHGVSEMSLGLQRDHKPNLMLNRWMNEPAILELTRQILHQIHDAESLDITLRKETDVLLHPNSLGTLVFQLTKDDVLDDDWVHNLCLLVETLSWVLTWLPAMKRLSNYSQYDPHGPLQPKTLYLNTLRTESSFLENGRALSSSAAKAQIVHLTLSDEGVRKFDGIVGALQQIREKALTSLRYDIRLKVLHYMGQSFSSEFLLTTEPADSDMFISLLNKELFLIGTKVNTMLSKDEIKFVYAGLSVFVTKACLRGSGIIKIINRNGIKKIILNIFTLQQMLRSLLAKSETVDLGEATRYFEMFATGEHAIFGKFQEERHVYLRADALNLLRLIYSEKLASSNTTSLPKSRYNELTSKVLAMYG